MLCEAPNTAVITATASTDRSQKAHTVQDELLDLSPVLAIAAMLLLQHVSIVCVGFHMNEHAAGVCCYKRPRKYNYILPCTSAPWCGARNQMVGQGSP